MLSKQDVEEVETIDGSWLGIDPGVDNLATCVDHRDHSFIVDGRHLKSQRRWFNKRPAHYQSIKDKQSIEGTIRRIERLHQKGRYAVTEYLNETVPTITDDCIETVYVGDGKGWKQKVNLGERTNQNSVQIPFDALKQKLQYKPEARGITFEVPEGHAPKCSLYDEAAVEHHDEYVGERVERGLFESSDGTWYNADVNGAVNTARKATGKPNSDLFESEEGVERVVDAPRRITLSDMEGPSTEAPASRSERVSASE